ncbi:MAG TPA: sugar transferase [Jatrophihabitantaceae bacterium]|nr:sugar transferase [Jatrophihabitantaceae bacterium]
MSYALRPAADGSADPFGSDLLSEAPRLQSTDAALHRLQWASKYRTALLISDLLCMVVATVSGYALRFGFDSSAATTRAYLTVGGIICVIWVVALQNAGGYDVRHLVSGPEEAKRVLRASAITVGALAIVCYATRTLVARGFVIGVVPLGVVLILFARLGVRRWVRARRERADWVHRVLVVGNTAAARHLLSVIQRDAGAGLHVIGVCTDDSPVGAEVARGIPVVGRVSEAAASAVDVDAAVIAVAANGLGPDGVRELGWQLEGTGRGLVIAPALTEIAGPRVHVSPVAGLPLVWLDQPQLGRVPQLLKRSLDLLGGSLLFLAATPIYLLTMIAIKATSRGPVFYRQVRLGINGTEFRMIKFRSMYRDAHDRRAQILDQNEQDGGGVLFKIRRDPRVTPVGRFIRMFSIDELPQLVHVLTGQMSLVGPRPLAAEDSIYTGSARRRLLVRPGLTGLWQVSGRSELSWDDAVRLDLYYVENWSLALDFSILARTVFAVLARRGAF